LICFISPCRIGTPGVIFFITLQKNVFKNFLTSGVIKYYYLLCYISCSYFITNILHTYLKILFLKNFSFSFNLHFILSNI
jgi:hypothetical protein